MYNITKNEAKVIDFLIRNFKEKNSINEIGRRLKISPRGIYKILKKLENNSIIVPEKIGIGIYYKFNFHNESSNKLGAFILSRNELNTYAKVILQDIMPLKDVVLSCILFGSVLEKGRDARDIDLLLVFKKKKFAEVNRILDGIRIIKPKIIHDVVQTPEDLVNNIKKEDKVILEIIKKGKIFCGAEIIMEAIKNGTS